MSKLEQPSISEYPIAESDKIKILNAYTVYKFMDPNKTDGRWLAVLKVMTTFQDKKDKTTKSSSSVRIFRWQWKQPFKWSASAGKSVPSGDYTWIKEQESAFNKLDIWNTVKTKVDEYIKEVN